MALAASRSILVGLVAPTPCWPAPTSAPGSGSCRPADGEHEQEVRDHAHHAIAPVWEANHVWLIFVLVVAGRRYPTAFGSIASTLAVPLFDRRDRDHPARRRPTHCAARRSIRGRSGRSRSLFALSSIITPFALGRVDRRDRVRPRAPSATPRGDLVTSWLNPTSVAIGRRRGRDAPRTSPPCTSPPTRPGSGARPGRGVPRPRARGPRSSPARVALAGLIVVRHDARTALARPHDRPRGSAASSSRRSPASATIALVAARRYEPARVTRPRRSRR